MGIWTKYSENRGWSREPKESRQKGKSCNVLILRKLGRVSKYVLMFE